MRTIFAPASTAQQAEPLFDALRRGETAVWLNPEVRAVGGEADREAVARAAARFERFAPLLRRLFPDDGWDGRIASALTIYDAPPAGLPMLLVKGDHALPMTGSVKARGGVHELLCYVERIAAIEELMAEGDSVERLLEAEARAVLGLHTVVVASTGNLGFSIGLVARALGLNAEIHMSSDAREWKKERLRALDAKVVEHECDYTETVARARVAATGARRSHFIDDERSPDLFFGYAAAAAELRAQLADKGLEPTIERPLVVYLPCGVGGAPGGILFGLKLLFGEAVIGVFVEPVASACMLAALALGGSAPVSVYDLGLDNNTLADGLAVPTASAFVLETVGPAIDAAIAVPDQAMLTWVRQVWATGRLRLEPSAASGFAAVAPFVDAVAQQRELDQRVRRAIHVVWTTGGALLPDDEFDRIIEG